MYLPKEDEEIIPQTALSCRGSFGFDSMFPGSSQVGRPGPPTARFPLDAWTAASAKPTTAKEMYRFSEETNGPRGCFQDMYRFSEGKAPRGDAYKTCACFLRKQTPREGDYKTCTGFLTEQKRPARVLQDV